MAGLPSVNEAAPCAAVTFTAAQAAVIARALADAEQYRRDTAATWCADCATTQDGACPDHLAYLAPVNVYRQLAAELALITKSAGRDVPAPRPASDLSRLGQERTMTNTTATASLPAARSLHEICELARLVNCGECWQVPGKPCTPEGDHVARFGRACAGSHYRPGPDRGPAGARRVHLRHDCPRRPGWCAVSQRGRHEAGQRPGDEPWARTSRPQRLAGVQGRPDADRDPSRHGRLAGGHRGPGVTRRSPVLGSRGAAQAWADDRARGAS